MSDRRLAFKLIREFADICIHYPGTDRARIASDTAFRLARYLAR